MLSNKKQKAKKHSDCTISKLHFFNFMAWLQFWINKSNVISHFVFKLNEIKRLLVLRWIQKSTAFFSVKAKKKCLQKENGKMLENQNGTSLVIFAMFIHFPWQF